MAQKTQVFHKDDDIEVNSITIAGTSVNTAVLLASGQAVDLNGETGGLIFDTDANTKMYASADDVITINVGGASDFTIAANTLTALSGSTIATNTIAETTAASGVTIDGLLVKDAGIVAGTSGYVDLNGETGGLIFDTDANTKMYASADDVITVNVGGAADFTIGANTLTALSGSTIATNTIAETTAGSGVTIDGLLIKDGGPGAIQAITGDGAITIQQGRVFLSKGSAAAITIAAPTATTHDYLTVVVVSLTAQAHVITSAVEGFNDKGSSGTATFGGAIGDSVTLTAYQGNWYTTAKVNVTIA